MKPADCHCHLDFEQFDHDREDVIERCQERLEFTVNAGSNIEHNRAALDLQENYPGTMVANLGLHPVYTESFDELEEVKQQIREELPAAIGEIGLDHHHVTASREKERQEEVFRSLLELAEGQNLPVVVHSRDAEREVVDILKEHDLPGVMLHCFNGTVSLAKEAVENGMIIGVTTQVIYSDRVEELAREIPLENILLETDSPYLFGDRNEPVNVEKSAKRIAELKDREREKVVEITTRNARDFFNK